MADYPNGFAVDKRFGMHQVFVCRDHLNFQPGLMKRLFNTGIEVCGDYRPYDAPSRQFGNQLVRFPRVWISKQSLRKDCCSGKWGKGPYEFTVSLLCILAPYRFRHVGLGQFGFSRIPVGR